MNDIMPGTPGDTNPTAELLSGLLVHDRSGWIPDIHVDDCADDACTGCDPQHLAEKATARARLEVMAFQLATGNGLVEPKVFTATLDAYRAEVLAVEREQRLADRRTWEHDLKSLREARDEVKRLQDRLHAVAMAKVWKNEDGKKFVFVEDIATPLLGLAAGGGSRA